MSKSFSHVLIDHLCQQESVLQGIFALCSVVFVLLIISLNIVESGSATYVIVIVDLVSVIGIGAIVETLLIICRWRRDG